MAIIKKANSISRLAKEAQHERAKRDSDNWWNQFTPEELALMAKNDPKMIEKAEKLGFYEVIGTPDQTPPSQEKTNLQDIVRL